MSSSPSSPSSKLSLILLSSTLSISSNSSNFFSDFDIQSSLRIGKVKRASHRNPTASHPRKSSIGNSDVVVAYAVGDRQGQADNTVKPLVVSTEEATITDHQAKTNCQRSSDGDTTTKTTGTIGAAAIAANSAIQPASASSRSLSSSEPPSTPFLLLSSSPPPSAPIAIPNRHTLGQMSEYTTVPLTGRVHRGGHFPYATSPGPQSPRKPYSSELTQYWPGPQPMVSSRHAAYKIYTNSGRDGQRNSKEPIGKPQTRPMSPSFVSHNSSPPQSNLLQSPPNTHPRRTRRNLRLTSLPSFHPTTVEIADLSSRPMHQHSSDAQRILHQQQRELIANATRTPPLYFPSAHGRRSCDPSPPRLCPLGSPGESVTPLILEGQQGGDYLLAGASRITTSPTRTLGPQTARVPLTEELVDELIRNEMTRITENLKNPRGSSPDAIAPRLTASSLAEGLLPNDD